jgi:hypothetical protein
MALRAKWQFMDRFVTHKIVYGPQVRFGPYENIILTGPGQYIANSSWHWGSYGSIWTGPYTAIWPSVPWTICYIILFKIVYGPQVRFGPYNILWATSRSINCHMAPSTMNYLLIIMCKKQRENVEIIDKHINIVMLTNPYFK